MCMITDSDYDEVKLHQQQERRARKAYACGECGRTIAAGERYLWVRQLYHDWGWGTERTCSHCRVCQAWLRRECGGFLWQGVYEDLMGHIEYEPRQTFAKHLELGRLVIGMRRDWRKADGTMMALPRLRATAPPEGAT